MDNASASLFQCPKPTGRGNDPYHVFLSYSRSDTGRKFTDHLYHSLEKAGTVPITVFQDAKSITIGEEFKEQIFGAISRSKISIPIISKNYATSKFCLRELVHMMDCRKNTSHIVLPIFYEVKPSDVQRLEGNFGDAYRSSKKDYKEEDIRKFEQALNDVSHLQVWASEKIAGGREGEFVQNVVDTVRSELRRDFQLDVTEDLVGIDDHVKTIKNWADSPATHARMIGIYGIGGMGKTTLAKAIYNELSKVFVDRSYILDIRDKADSKGIPYVQNQLIKGVLPKEGKVSEVDDGVSLIKSKLQCKKVLILLDDIDGGIKGGQQLDALARKRDWFMAGSIILVTTRYKDVLDQAKFEEVKKYPMNELDWVHSMLLFNRQAFRMNCSLRHFDDTSREIISTMGGLPLALVVVGSYLFGKTNPKVWTDTLKQLKEQPHENVREKLMISYNALKPGHREIFLDIACFFVGKKSKFAMYMWDDCGFYASQGIEELKLRCLIKIGDDGKLKMHDQLRDLGRSIVAQGEPLERRSRLWIYEEAPTVLVEKKGTEKIQAICLGKYYGGRPWQELFNRRQMYTNEQFKNLPSLRFLRLREAALTGDFNQLFSELRWLHWFDNGFDYPFTATNLQLRNLLVLKLSHNRLTKDWGGWSSMKAAKRLKVLNLGNCRNLSCTPDLSTFTELEILILKNCDELERVHPSIGEVKCLVSLDLSQCASLKTLPEELGELEELKELILDSGGIIKIPTSIGSLKKLEKLSASRCWSLKEIPSSIGNLSSLQYLNLRSCMSLKEIPSSIGDLQDLQHLDMTNSAIQKLPSDIERLKKLRKLRLYQCKGLWSLPDLPSSLTYLTFSCQSRTVPQLSHLNDLQELGLNFCFNLESIPKLPSSLLKLCVVCGFQLTLPKLDGLEYLEELSIDACSNVSSLDLSQNNCLKRLHAKRCYNLVEIKGLDNLQSLEEIVIHHCETIPRLILPELKGLKRLKADRCDKLVEIRGLDKAKCLEALDIGGCTSMETLPDLSGCEELKSLVVRGCKKLAQLRGLEKLNLREVNISGCDALETMPQLPGPHVNRNHEESHRVSFSNIDVK